ncbi:MAG: NADH-quinone oxidoreductase subunit L, partial [Alphaproteobacteria bacterium]|nr:NADH-quinone oxidoreductase subunit L [Alphaproteobacteria bacterium]
HLMTHAFFKALLFLGAGSVIHAMSDEQDMRRMGGIWRLIPVTYILMWVGSLALAGIPFFAGYYSKDMILESDFAVHTRAGLFAFEMGVAAAFLTAFYSWRLLLMTFHGAPRADHDTMHHVHESPRIMLIPLYVLGFGAVFAGAIFFPLFVGEYHVNFWGASILTRGEDVLEAAHHVPHWVPLLPLVLAVSGIGLGYLCYLWKTDLPGVFVRMFRPVYKLFYNKWYFDEL